MALERLTIGLWWPRRLGVDGRGLGAEVGRDPARQTRSTDEGAESELGRAGGTETRVDSQIGEKFGGKKKEALITKLS